MRLRFALPFILLIASGCAAGLCERRAQFFQTRCTGTDVVYSPDPECPAKLEGCSKAQLALFEAYVACLEQANQCSMAIVAQCARKHPGGVNLACNRPLPE